MPASNQQIFLVNGIIVDFFGNPINIFSSGSAGPTGSNGATGEAGLPGVTGPAGSTAATSKFIKEWITAGNERLIITAEEINPIMLASGNTQDQISYDQNYSYYNYYGGNPSSLSSLTSPYSSGFLIDEISQSLADIQIQLWRVNSAFIDPETERSSSTFWELVSPNDYLVNVNANTGAIYINLTYRLVNSTRTRAVVIC